MHRRDDGLSWGTFYRSFIHMRAKRERDCQSSLDEHVLIENNGQGGCILECVLLTLTFSTGSSVAAEILSL